MKTGDIVTDSRARAWTLHALLGEGIWGRTWAVRDDDGRQRALKVPYEATELPPASAGRAALMRAAAEEQAERVAAGEPHLLAADDRITLPTGGVALLFPALPTTLARQLHSGLPLTEALTELLAVVDLLEKARSPHGNLRPSNILIGPHGEPVLTDVATPSASTLLADAERSNPSRRRWAPPDHIASDTWAVCQALYAAVMLEDGDSGSTLPPAPMDGLDKVARAALKDHAIARLKRDGANTRFVGRAAERLVALLARGLSKETDPSPPYRFLRPADLRPRLAEVVALIHPTVDSVGKLLLASTASGDVFHGPGPVGFTVSVALSEGLSDADDLVCGVRLTDLDATGDGRVALDNIQFTVNRHPSGRLRFEFNLPEVAPGRYTVRVAFSVKDSGDEPTVAEGSFEVRPPPGYVPPQREAEGPVALSFPGRRPSPAEEAPIGLKPMGSMPDEDDEDASDDDPTVLMPKGYDPLSDPGGELIDPFPRPLAPSSPGSGFRAEPDELPTARPAGAWKPNPTDGDALWRSPPTPPPDSAFGAARPAGVHGHSPRPVLAAVPTAPSEPDTGSHGASVDLEPWSPPPAEPPSVVQTHPSPPPPVGLAVPTPGIARPAPSSPAPAPLPTDDPWQTSQVEEADFFAGPIPGQGGVGQDGDDLIPTAPRAPGPLDAARAWLSDLTQRDTPTIGVAMAGCFLLLVLAMALARAC